MIDVTIQNFEAEVVQAADPRLHPPALTLAIDPLQTQGTGANPQWAPNGGSVEVVTYASSITLTLTGKPNSQVFRCTLTGNVTVNISGGTDGQRFIIELIQDGTGSRTVTLSSDFAFGSDITSFTATTTASKTDMIGCIYNSSASKARVIAVAKGY